MAGYIGPIPVPQATQSRETFTATASQTSFGTAGYQVGYLDVFMNGVKLATADFTATNGSDVVLASGAAVNDIIEVVSYSAFEVLNQNFTGTTTADNLTVTGNLTVDGTTTTINSTTLNVDDINITVASGAADSAAANGAGLTVDGAGATFNYSHSGTKWTMNKPLDVAGTLVSDGLTVDTDTLYVDSANNRVGVGTASPSDLLELSGSTAQPAIRLTDSDVSGLYHRIFTPTNTGLAISADTGNVAADSFIRLDVDGTEAMRITSAGTVEMYGNAPSTLHLKSSAPILAFTDTNSFPDANDRFHIRGTSSDGIAAGSMGFYDSSADTTTTYFTIRDDGKIGIRNTTPTAIGLQIGGDPSGTVAPSMCISLPDAGGTNTSLAIRGGSPAIFFDSTGGGTGRFLMDSADIVFKSGTISAEGSEIARVRWDGGITFNGDTAAANALDDYEEGTFLPGVEFENVGGTATTASSTYTTGDYTKIGDTVTVNFNISGIVYGNGTGTLRLTGLPFAPYGIEAYPGKSTASASHLLAAVTATNYMNAITAYGTSILFFRYASADGSGGWNFINSGNASTIQTNSINGSFTYKTNA
jgi:hypothetical protein